MTAPTLRLDPKTTALLIIDLQNGIVARASAPHASSLVVANAAKMADAFRRAGALVVLVNVAYAADGADRPTGETDAARVTGGFPPGFSDLVADLKHQPTDLAITKRQWGAFYGTELDLQLRRRGIRTVVLAGIATNMGLESTARNASEHGYNVVFVEDAMSSFAADAHAFAVGTIFPRLGRVRSTAQTIAALTGGAGSA